MCSHPPYTLAGPCCCVHSHQEHLETVVLRWGPHHWSVGGAGPECGSEVCTTRALTVLLQSLHFPTTLSGTSNSRYSSPSHRSLCCLQICTVQRENLVLVLVEVGWNSSFFITCLKGWKGLFFYTLWFSSLKQMTIVEYQRRAKFSGISEPWPIHGSIDKVIFESILSPI